MTHQNVKKYISHWVPAIFCAILSYMALYMQMSSDSGAWKPAFYCFLPMCFFGVGQTTLRMQHEISELRKQVAELQNK